MKVSETLAGRDWKQLRRRMRADHGDALLLVWGNAADTETACQEIALRAKEATIGVPNDTRQAYKDGTNGFERVLPGAERMYPDTDLPPLAIRQERLDRIAARLPEPVWDRETRYRALRLPPETIPVLIAPQAAALFDRLTGELGLPPRFVAVLLAQRLKALRRRGVPVETLTPEEIYAVCAAHARGRLSREGVPFVLRLVAEHPPVAGGAEAARVAAVFAEHNFTPLTDAELDEAISRRLARLDSRKFATPQQKARYLCGLILDDFVGRVPAEKVVQRVAARLPAAAPVSRQA